MEIKQPWRLESYIAPEKRTCQIPGEYWSELEVYGVAEFLINDILETISDPNGLDIIQVFVVRPDGTKFRYLPLIIPDAADKKAPEAVEVWGLMGYDTYSDEFYPLEGEYYSEMAVYKAAARRLRELEKTQPSETSGGQTDDGIQDQVWIIRPDGTSFRYLPPRT